MPLRRMVLTFAGFAGVMLLLGYWMLRLLMIAGGQESFPARFERVAPGMALEAVTGSLGQPQRRSRLFYAPRAGMAAYRRAAAGNAGYYLYWIKGGTYYAVAFDERDRVLFTLFVAQD